MKNKQTAERSFDRVDFRAVGAAEPIFTLDMDKKCPRCGKGGASDKGVCLDCALDNAKAVNSALENVLKRPSS